ncbi:MAG: DUF6588 family protein [Bdellovibrionales bacterium]
MLKKLILLSSLFFIAGPAFGQSGNIFTDPDFGREEFDLISEDLSAAFVHTTNSGGSSLGSVWGVEAGIVAGLLEADNLQKVAESISGEDQDELAYLPYAGIVAGLSLPFGIGGEVSMVPEVDLDDGSFSNFSASLRWSITDMIPLVGSFSPLKITTHLSHGTTAMDYAFSLSGSSTENADFSIKNTEIGVTAGFNLFILEPYLGFSTVKTKSTLIATTDFPGVTNPDEFNASFSGARMKAGLLLKLPLLRFGLEASTLHSSTRYTFKMSLKI